MGAYQCAIAFLGFDRKQYESVAQELGLEKKKAGLGRLFAKKQNPNSLYIADTKEKSGQQAHTYVINGHSNFDGIRRQDADIRRTVNDLYGKYGDSQIYVYQKDGLRRFNPRNMSLEVLKPKEGSETGLLNAVAMMYAGLPGVSVPAGISQFKIAEEGEGMTYEPSLEQASTYKVPVAGERNGNVTTLDPDSGKDLEAVVQETPKPSKAIIATQGGLPIVNEPAPAESKPQQRGQLEGIIPGPDELGIEPARATPAKTDYDLGSGSVDIGPEEDSQDAPDSSGGNKAIDPDTVDDTMFSLTSGTMPQYSGLGKRGSRTKKKNNGSGK